MAFKQNISQGTGTLTAAKQKWLLDSVKSGKLTFGQAVYEMNESSKTMDGKLPSNVPQVKSGELTIEDALNQARETNEMQRAEEGSSQCNFSVYKYNRYRWQKRILQIDFNTQMLCSIEKGIIKRQLPFSSITQLINQVIHGNIYEVPVYPSPGVQEPSPSPGTDSLREGQLYLQRGGLASFRWLHEGQLTLFPVSRDQSAVPASASPMIIHFSDGNASVEKPRSCDTFTLLTNRHEYQFRVPVSEQAKSTDAIKSERDEWVQAIDRLCLEWKRRSQIESQNVYECIGAPLRTGGAGATGGTAVGIGVGGGRGRETERGVAFPAGVTVSGESSDEDVPVPKPASLPAPPLSPRPAGPFPQFAMAPPPPPMAPAPPPLPSKFPMKPTSKRTKAFHWDLVAQDKVRIDAARLFEQFSVQDMGILGGLESNNNVNIMLNDKPGELKDKLCIINEEDGGLTDEHIASLRRYVPTPDDVEMYRSHKGPACELHVVDQYMMEYLLAVGNYLNENAGKEKAKGFRLSSLTKLSQLRGKDRKFTLLHALVDQIMLQEPHLATFFQELTEFETVPGGELIKVLSKKKKNKTAAISVVMSPSD
ncbi:hypothetical protein JZ751_023936 [Albula glossodonta]|uniref:FH2 domain-containing protein n=1 Tax=Albula glossodonta TaxID=121402 RepID=A0A8T2NIY9_9TELE|nr:hypothetical protein JZ751_023936 [Albula glossodonta]